MVARNDKNLTLFDADSPKRMGVWAMTNKGVTETYETASSKSDYFFRRAARSN